MNKEPGGKAATSLYTTRKRWFVAFLAIVLLFTVLIFRIGYIQVIATEKYGVLAAESQTKDEIISPHRGRILDRNMKELAVSTDSYRIYLRLLPYDSEKSDLKKWEEQRPLSIDLLAEILGVEKKSLEEATDTDAFRVRVASDVPKAKAEKIQEGIAEEELTIIELERDSTRHYPMGAFASHVLGGVNADGYGRNGIEYEYDSILQGQVGRSIAQTDSMGNPLSSGGELTYSNQDGLNVVLTIDETVQYFVERIVAETYARTEPDRVQAIVLDPKTGDVLAMSNYPEYDPNDAYKPVGLSEEKMEAYNKLTESEKVDYAIKNIWRNSAVSDTYEPGSVFKLLTAAIALETGVAVPEDPVYYCDGSVRVEDRTIQCHIYPNGHGQQTLTQGVANSCNPTMVEAAQAIGYARFYQYLELFGVTKYTGIDLPGEANPLVFDPPLKEGEIVEYSIAKYVNGVRAKDYGPVPYTENGELIVPKYTRIEE
ncbi:MAG: hypothetical protein LBU41_03785, partial [Clostridiales Family XIII bacterium]|nr:hypothetical protein [Clostridiales Family XIII bacterium]